MVAAGKHGFSLTKTTADRQSHERLEWGLNNLTKTESERKWRSLYADHPQHGNRWKETGITGLLA